MDKLTPRKLIQLVGKEVGRSGWLTVTQDRISAFAECTEDRQWIHVDEEKAKKGPLGGTIAHGYLVLSLIPHFLEQNSVFSMKVKMVINYGLNRARFLHPVRPGERVRNVAVLKAMEKKGFRRLLLTIENTVEIDGKDKPALVAELLAMIIL